MQKNKQTQKKQKLEKVIQNEIFDFLIKHNYFFWRENNIPVMQKTGAKYRYRALPKHTPKGLPDIMIVNKGRFIGVEVKAKYRKLTPEQADYGLKLLKNGGYYIIARSVDELQNGLREIASGRKDFTHDVYTNSVHARLDNTFLSELSKDNN